MFKAGVLWCRPVPKRCTKRPYEERIQAARAARLIEVCAPKDREITPGPLNIYLCVECQAWHWGHDRRKRVLSCS
jgi:hypothetical protein